MADRVRAAAATTVALLALAMASGASYGERARSADEGHRPVQTKTVRLADPELTVYATAFSFGANDPWVRMLPRSDSAAQVWVVTPHPGDGWAIVNRSTEGCVMLDLAGSLFGYVVQDRCTGRPHEAWEMRSIIGSDRVTFRNLAADRCLTRQPDDSADTRLRLFTCDGVRQDFRLVPGAP